MDELWSANRPQDVRPFHGRNMSGEQPAYHILIKYIITSHGAY